jgi:hypothetical protein
VTDDPRSRKVAVVADALLDSALDGLREDGWGVMQLPPAELDPETARAWVDLTAEQVAEYQRTGYEVVLRDDGVWGPALDEALTSLGARPLS